MAEFFNAFSGKQWELLQRRAKRVGQVSQNTETRQRIEVLLIHLQDETYALPIVAIQAVYKDVRITPLPKVPAHIAGIANIRSQLVTVLDLASILGIPATVQTNLSTLVTVAHNQMHTAFLVHQVVGTTTLYKDNLQSLSFANGIEGAYLQGITPEGTVLIDVETLINDPKLHVNHRR